MPSGGSPAQVVRENVVALHMEDSAWDALLLMAQMVTLTTPPGDSFGHPGAAALARCSLAGRIVADSLQTPNVVPFSEGSRPKLLDQVRHTIRIPAYHPATETDQGRRAAYTGYELAATASLGYKIANETSFGTRDANLIFEAVAASGVVLGSAQTAFRIVSGGTSGTASARIAALSDEEIRRVTSVQVRWAYGR
jgi:hypothetical protein